MEKKKLEALLIQSDKSIKEAMQQLDKTGEKILFVVTEGNVLLGTLTDGDVRRGLLDGANFADSVKHLMRGQFISLDNGESELKKRAENLIIQNRIEHVPVLNRNKEIVDVVSWTDFFNPEEEKEKSFYPNPVVVMAGGKGTRLDPFTKVLPKPLIPIGNKPVIEVIMERFFKYGFHRFIYTLNYKKEYLKLFLTENDFPYSMDWVEEPDFLGTAGSLSLVKDKIHETFFVINCDSLLDVAFDQILEWHCEQKAAITIIGCHNEVRIPFGVLKLSNGKLDKMLEKPVHDVIINTGLYVMEPSILDFIELGMKMDMNDLIETVSRKDKITVYPIHGGWLDIGRWEEYRKLYEDLGDI